MKIKSFQVTNQKFLQEMPAGEILPTWFEDSVHRWIDIEDPTEDGLAKLLEPLKIDTNLLKACLEPGSSRRYEIMEKILFIEIPTQASREDSTLTHISLLCLPTTLVTIHTLPLPVLAAMVALLEDRTPLKSATASALVYQLIVKVAVENFFEFTVCRQNYETLSQRLLEISDSVEPEDVFRLRKQITNIGDTNEDHASCVDFLQKVESTHFSVRDQLEHLRDFDRTLDRYQRTMDRLEDNIKDLHQQFLILLQDRTGNRLKVLTVLSAIFLPLTLISGIYGMNFGNMPELHVPFGYYAVLGFMGFLGIGMLAFFYKKGWFD